MKRSLLILVILAFSSQVSSQKYDLLVKTNGDSIACRIDSITDALIYFEMLNRKHWIKTNINKDEIIEYKRNAIDKKMFIFKYGSSYISSPKPEPITSIKESQRNSIFFGIFSVNYSRMIPLNQSGLSLAAGLSFIDGVALQTEISSLLGSSRHFFEPGFIWWHDEIDDFFMLKIGYRFQGTRGFLFRIGPLFTISDSDFWVFPSMSIGYSF